MMHVVRLTPYCFFFCLSAFILMSHIFAANFSALSTMLAGMHIIFCISVADYYKASLLSSYKISLKLWQIQFG